MIIRKIKKSEQVHQEDQLDHQQKEKQAVDLLTEQEDHDQEQNTVIEISSSSDSDQTDEDKDPTYYPDDDQDL